MDELERQYQQERRESIHLRQWLEFGMDRGWISDPFCAGHDEPPITDYEYRMAESGTDPCIILVRILSYHEGPRWEPDTSIDHSDETRPE
jgi:hypothetical protein